MILFFHGYGSSPETNKYTVIEGKKACEPFSYDMSYKRSCEFMDYLVHLKQPEILVGHSLGGYWALHQSIKHKIPCVLINPSIAPIVVEDYPPIVLSKMEGDNIHRVCHAELGDEVLDMKDISAKLEPYMKVVRYPDGHHRVKYLDDINRHIEHIRYYDFI